MVKIGSRVKVNRSCVGKKHWGKTGVVESVEVRPDKTVCSVRIGSETLRFRISSLDNIDEPIVLGGKCTCGMNHIRESERGKHSVFCDLYSTE